MTHAFNNQLKLIRVELQISKCFRGDDDNFAAAVVKGFYNSRIKDRMSCAPARKEIKILIPY